MSLRIPVALLALTALTAFAPSPFPRKGRKAPTDLTAAALQGLWKVERLTQSSTPLARATRSTLMSHIRIQDGRWTFMRNNGGTVVPSTSYRLMIHSKQTPLALDGLRDTNNTPYMLAIARQVGDTVEVLYRFGGTRPDNFENPPPGCWRLTLRREK
jgi:hypothetical protein